MSALPEGAGRTAITLLGALLACGQPQAKPAPAAPRTRLAQHGTERARQPEPRAPEPAPVVPGADAATPSGTSTALPEQDETRALLALAPSSSASIGAPGAGELRGGVRLPARGPGYLHNPKRPEQARYGTVELVQAIVTAARKVHEALPGSELVVNDLSLPQGGPIAQHGSHQSGRDADILFYVLDREGAPLPSVGVPIEPDDAGIDFKDLRRGDDDVHLRLDAPRTWRFVAELLAASGDELQRIFIAEHLRTRLLKEAARAKTAPALVARFEDVTCQPGTPHDDHMHVRWFCSAEDIGLGCLDKPPLYPYRLQGLAALGLAPVLESPALARARKHEVAARTTTPEQARKRAGPMHREVRRFLERRKAWLAAPRPGRPYCK